jgi:hypothetical protein
MRPGIPNWMMGNLIIASAINGARADFVYLGDRGIVGNGHMMMLENNSDALAEQIVSWIESP